MKLIATATFGLESVVRREVGGLGYEAKADRPGWIAFEADAPAVARANLGLRASDRVLVELASFPASDFDALFEQAKNVAWEEWLPPSARFPVRGRSVKSRLASVPACQSVVKKAIVDRLRDRHRVASLAEDGPTFPVEVALLADEARVLLDTSGAGLHKRGYRPAAGEAPLKETLAAGLLLLTVWSRGMPFLDPFCGSGTIAIEAALIARNRAPGIQRTFVSESWPAIPAATWARAREEGRDLEVAPAGEPLHASDVDGRALEAARRSAERAGVARDVRFEERPYEALEGFGEYGCLVTNPPYGERLGEAEPVRALYRSMPSVFRKLPTWSFYVLTARRDLEELVGQPASRRRKLFNGPIECTYYQFFGPRPGRERDRPAFGGIPDVAKRQAEIFSNRLSKRARHLRRWPKRRGTDCYRIYEGDIKEVPLVVDRYGPGLRIAPLPHPVLSRTPAEQEDWLDLMARTAGETLNVPASSVAVAGRPGGPGPTIVHEAGMAVEVDLSGEKPPGFEPGDRELRRLLRESSSEKRVLVLEEGEASFGVAAALGGAREVTLVEPSTELEERTRSGFELNAVPLEKRRCVVSDPASFLERDEGTYDVVLCTRALGEILEPLRARVVPESLVLLALRDGGARVDAKLLEGWESEDWSDRLVPEELRKRPRRVFRLRKVELGS